MARSIKSDLFPLIAACIYPLPLRQCLHRLLAMTFHSLLPSSTEMGIVIQYSPDAGRASTALLSARTQTRHTFNKDEKRPILFLSFCTHVYSCNSFCPSVAYPTVDSFLKPLLRSHLYAIATSDYSSSTPRDNHGASRNR